MVWAILAALLVCYIWYKIVGTADAEADALKRTSDSPGLAEAARGASRLVSEVGRGVSLIPNVLDDLDQFVSKSRAKQIERVRNESGLLGKTLMIKEIVLKSALETATSRRTLQRELDADPLLKRYFEENMSKFADSKGHIEARLDRVGPKAEAVCSQTDPIPTEFMTLKSYSIPFLLHFTRAKNLESIFKHGIVPVSLCPDLGISPVVNDKFRWDRRTNSSSFSIGHPNSKMLWKYRQLEPTEEWVVLAVDPSIIWQSEVAFCPHNAADRRIASREIGSLKGYAALKEMIGRDKRGVILPYEPADEQAEILVFDVVKPNQIMGVFFLDDATRARLDDVCSSVASFSAFESKAVFATRSHAAQLSENAAIIENYIKTVRQFGENLRTDPGLAADLDKQIEAFLTSRAEIEARLVN